MGLLDQSLISEQVRKIKVERFNKVLERKIQRVSSKIPLRKYKRKMGKTSFKRNVPKRLIKEWGERMKFLRSI